MALKYVSDIIGDDYKNWHPSDKILISQSTGSGKTWFVLKVLLKHAKEQGKHLVYFCNRKFLSQQIQAEAEKLLLDELGKDKDALAAHLHIRTYQHSELVFDYPNIRAVDENGKVIEYRDAEGHLLGYEYEVMESDVLYYVYDESFYMVGDAGFNANTHYWYDKKEIWNNQESVSIFLAATPDPLLLYLQFQVSGRADLKTLCRKYIAAHFINKDNHRERWMRYYHPPYIRMVQERDRICSLMLPYYQPEYHELEARKKLAERTVGQTEGWILEKCINPYSDLFTEVDKAYNTASKLFNYVYLDERSLQERYDYLNTYYFDDMETLAKRIAMSVRANNAKATKEADKQRWLVFVRRYVDAKVLQANLRLEGCKSVAISAEKTKRYDGSPCKRKGTVKKTLETLVHKQELDCDVLITTSVLDCGISLKSANVNHLAVCQPEKTSFLQMIGRIRAAEGHRVNLYVRSFSPSEIRGYRDKAVKMFLYLAQLYLKDEKIHRSTLGYGKQPNMEGEENFLIDGMISLLPAMTLQKLLEELDNDRNRMQYMYYDDHGNKSLRVRKQLPQQVNPLALIYYLSQVYYYTVQLPKYEDDPHYFLKEQLSWIGKTYDPECWIDYQSSRDALHHFLEQATHQAPMDKEDQAEFRRKCFAYIRCLRIPPESVQEEKRRHPVQSGTFPGKDKLNDIFIDMGLPYQIESKQNKKLLIDKTTGERVINPETGKPKVNNKSYWFIHSVDVESLRPGLEEKREAKRIEKERKREERAQQQAQAQEPKPEREHDPDNPFGVVILNYPKKKQTHQESVQQAKPPKNKPAEMQVRIMYGDEPYNPNG